MRRKRKKGHFRRKYSKLRYGRCKQLGHNTRGCKGTTPNATEKAQKEGTSGKTSRGTTKAKTKEGDLGPGIDWGYDTDVKRTTRKQGGDTINSQVYFSFILQPFQTHKLVNFFYLLKQGHVLKRKHKEVMGAHQLQL